MGYFQSKGKNKPLKRTKMAFSRKKLKSSQAPVTTEIKKLWSKIAAVGCIACRKDGVFNDFVSIHHIDGRTKPGAHMNVLPLCAGHHQDGTGNDKSMIAIHPWIARFESRYGSQNELYIEVMELVRRG